VVEHGVLRQVVGVVHAGVQDTNGDGGGSANTACARDLIPNSARASINAEVSQQARFNALRPAAGYQVRVHPQSCLQFVEDVRPEHVVGIDTRRGR
jgi:hypothetical protein